MKHVYRFTLAIALAAAAIAQSQPKATTKGTTSMKRLTLQTTIQEGKDRQVDILFEGPSRKLIQITLRNGAILASHTAPVPITIQGIAGKGTLFVGNEREAVALEPGALVTLEPNVVHEIQASPAVSILLTQFTGSM